MTVRSQIFAALLAILAGPTQAQLTVATVEQGRLHGAAQGKVARFLGIPYAAAPVGPLRWRSPQPAAHWHGERQAVRFSDSCPQEIGPGDGGFGPWTHEYVVSGPVSEDCLYLNVWTPAKRLGDRFPVLLWIHGGGFVAGSASVPIYDGAAMAARGVVVISINYRLGLYGFLALRELADEPGGGNGNFGLLDQIAALRWMRHNVSAFGGDPANITIAGQSAGAMSVSNLILSSRAKGLFQKAIAQSGTGMGIPPASLSAAEADGASILAASGARALSDLRALTPPQLSAVVARSVSRSAGMLRFAPVADGDVLPADPVAALASGRYNDTPILTGLTADEGSGIAPVYRPKDAGIYSQMLDQRFGQSARDFAAIYPLAQPEISAPAMQRDRGIAGMLFWSEARARTSRFPVWRYLFAHVEPGRDSGKYGAFHSSEIPYVLGTLNMAPERGFTQGDFKLSDTMSSYWVNFMRYGNPNGEGLIAWPTNTKPNEIMMFGDRIGAQPAMAPDALERFRAFVADGGQIGIF